MGVQLYAPQVVDHLKTFEDYSRCDYRDYIVDDDAAAIFRRMVSKCDQVVVRVDSVKYGRCAAKKTLFEDAVFPMGPKQTRALRVVGIPVIVLEGLPSYTTYVDNLAVTGFDTIRRHNNVQLRVTTVEYLYYIHYRARGLKDDTPLMRALRTELGLPVEKKPNPFVEPTRPRF